jgi:metal-sulfur cluster biosynthetic enzyme
MYTQAALQQTSNALAELDAVLSLASVAVDLGLVRPVLVADNVIVIKVSATLLPVCKYTLRVLCYILPQAPSQWGVSQVAHVTVAVTACLEHTY